MGAAWIRKSNELMKTTEASALRKSQRTCKNCKRLTRQTIKIKRRRVQLGEHWQQRLATVMCAIEFSQKL